MDLRYRNFWRQRDKSRGGRHNHFGSLRIFDSFNRSNGAMGHTDTGQTWISPSDPDVPLVISSGMASGVAGNDSGASASVDLSSVRDEVDKWYVEVTVRLENPESQINVFPTGEDNFNGPLVAFRDNGDGTQYAFILDNTPPHQFQQYVGLPPEYVFTLPQDVVVRFEFVTSTHAARLLFNGIEMYSWVSNNLEDGEVLTLRYYNDSDPEPASKKAFDNLTVDQLGNCAQWINFGFEEVGALPPTLPTGAAWLSLNPEIVDDPYYPNLPVFGTEDDTFRAAGSPICCTEGTIGMRGTFRGDCAFAIGEVSEDHLHVPWGALVEWNSDVTKATVRGINLGVIGEFDYPLTPYDIHEAKLAYDIDTYLLYFYVDGNLVTGDPIQMPAPTGTGDLYTGIMVSESDDLIPGQWLNYSTGCMS